MTGSPPCAAMTIQPYALIPPADRRRTLAHGRILREAAERAVYEGWRPYEADLVVAAARAHRLMLWPTLLRRLDADARACTAEMF